MRRSDLHKFAQEDVHAFAKSIECFVDQNMPLHGDDSSEAFDTSTQRGFMKLTGYARGTELRKKNTKKLAYL